MLAPKAAAQAQFEWQATHDGGHGQIADYGSCAAVDSSGNIFLASQIGLVFGLSEYNVDINKYSSSGVLLWTRNFDLPLSTADSPHAAAVAANGDFVVLGTSNFSSPQIGSDLFLLRYDTNGNLLWSLDFSGVPGSGNDIGVDLGFDLAGNIVIAGTVEDSSGQTDMLVKAFTPAGASLWETRIDGPQLGHDRANDMLIDDAGAIFVAGVVDSNGVAESAVAKLDSQGQFQWLQRINLSIPSLGTESLQRLTSDGQGGVVAVGSAKYLTALPSLNYDFGTVVRVNGSGTMLWNNGYGGSSSSGDVIVDDHGVASALFFTPLATIPRAVIKRYSSSGQLLSTQDFDGLAHQGASPGRFLRGSAGQIYVCGTELGNTGSTGYTAYLMQQDSGGATNWIRTYPGSGFGMGTRFMIDAISNRVVLFGTVYRANFDSDALLMQIDLSDAPQAYCTAKLNSLGCTPRIGFTGLSSAAANAGFRLVVDRVRNNKSGLFFYGVNGAAATPFGGGTLCVAAPVRRTPASNSAGSALPADDCSGVYALDMNAFAAGSLGGNPIAALQIPGTAVVAQIWGRDPGFSAPNNVTLSDGLRYVVLP
jgi:hypothetical protein